MNGILARRRIAGVDPVHRRPVAVVAVIAGRLGFDRHPHCHVRADRRRSRPRVGSRRQNSLASRASCSSRLRGGCRTRSAPRTLVSIPVAIAVTRSSRSSSAWWCCACTPLLRVGDTGARADAAHLATAYEYFGSPRALWHQAHPGDFDRTQIYRLYWLITLVVVVFACASATRSRACRGGSSPTTKTSPGVRCQHRGREAEAFTIGAAIAGCRRAVRGKDHGISPARSTSRSCSSSWSRVWRPRPSWAA